jgi:hypothetical protein
MKSTAPPIAARLKPIIGGYVIIFPSFQCTSITQYINYNDFLGLSRGVFDSGQPLIALFNVPGDAKKPLLRPRVGDFLGKFALFKLKKGELDAFEITN